MSGYYAVFMAGGSGTRLWPLSRRSKPKQMLPLVGEHSMFSMSVERIRSVFSPDRIHVVAGREHIADLAADAPEVPAENFIAEPFGRNNAPAIALASRILYASDPDAVLAILPVDHYIGRPQEFADVLAAAEPIARDGAIVTLGISPTYPTAGYGYIRQGVRLGERDGFSYYRSEGFTEKPDIVRATQYLRSGIYSWNSGMFIVSAERMLQEFAHQQPSIIQALDGLEEAMRENRLPAFLDAAWQNMPAISIDYAIMEKATDVIVIPADIGWSDVGSWESLFDILPQDKFGNCAQGRSSEERIILDTRNTLVFSERLAVTIGVEDLVIIDTEDALLICHKDRTQDVRDVVKYLQESGSTQYL
jgi:mannose-1-phosphate guanylyltransferase